MAGIEPPADRVLDGASLLPIFSNAPVARSKPLFWHYFRSIGAPKAALRLGDWTILGHWDQEKLGPGGSLHPGDMNIIKQAELIDFELFNLRNDLAQEKNLAQHAEAQRETLARQLQQEYRTVRDEGPSWQVPPRP